MIEFSAYNLVSKKNWLDIFLGASFFSAVFQDLLMVIAGLSDGLPFGFHQNFINNPYIGLYLFKVAKYIFFIGALLLSFQLINRIQVLKAMAVLIVFLLPCILIDISNKNYLLIALGFKAWLPIFAYFIGVRMDVVSYIRLINLIKISLWINFFIAVIQYHSYTGNMLFSNQNFADIFEVIRGIRVGGAFLEPNTLGLYGLMCILILSIGARLSIVKFNLTYIGLAYLLIIISWSRTAMLAATFTLITLSVVPAVRSNRKHIYYFLVIVLLTIFVLMLFSRGFESIQIRLRDFEDLLLRGNFSIRILGSGFGYGTVSAATYGHVFRDFSISVINGDSQWIAFYIQGGYWLLIGALGVFLYAFFAKSFEVKVLLFAMFLVGFGIQFIEAWPFGFLAFTLIGYCDQHVDSNNSL